MMDIKVIYNLKFFTKPSVTNNIFHMAFYAIGSMYVG